MIMIMMMAIVKYGLFRSLIFSAPTWSCLYCHETSVAYNDFRYFL